MTYRADPKKEQMWKTHISQANQFDGGLGAYCRSQNISVHSLGYWRKRFDKSSEKEASRGSSPFIPVKVEAKSPAARSLPDPKWMAEFILHLQGSAQ